MQRAGRRSCVIAVGRRRRAVTDRIGNIDRAGVIAITRHDNIDRVRAARTGLDDAILVEQYIPGREFALEGVLTDGALQVLAVFDKPDPLEGPYFEETIYVTPSRVPAATEGRIVDHVRRASHALGLSHGPIHAECRVTPGGTVYVLEVAARPIGGLCSRVLSFTGAPGWGLRHGAEDSLEAVLLQHAVGQSIAHCAREEAAAAVMMIPIPGRGMYKGVAGEDEARAVPGVTEKVVLSVVRPPPCFAACAVTEPPV